MFYLTDSFSVENVAIYNISNLRFEEITPDQIKAMFDDHPRTVLFTNRKLLGDLNRLAGAIYQTVGKEEVVVDLKPTDVLVLFQERHFAERSNARKYFKVTCRRDYEVFGFDEGSVILDRDGNIVDKAVEVEDVHRLMDKCRQLNTAS